MRICSCRLDKASQLPFNYYALSFANIVIALKSIPDIEKLLTCVRVRVQ